MYFKCLNFYICTYSICTIIDVRYYYFYFFQNKDLPVLDLARTWLMNNSVMRLVCGEWKANGTTSTRNNNFKI